MPVSLKGEAASAVSQGAVSNPRRKFRAISPMVVLLAILLVILIVPPIVVLVQSSFYTTLLSGAQGEFTFDYWKGLVQDQTFLLYAWNTTVYATFSALIAIVFGVTQAWIVERTDTPGRQYVFLFSVISICTPGVLYAVAWILIFGNAGPVNGLLMRITGSTEPLLNVYSMWGMIVIEGISWSPLAFLLLSAIFRSADPSFEEASMMSGAGMYKTFRDITLKLSLPAILALALLIVVRAFETFEVPALVGMPGNIYLLTTQIYSDMTASLPPDPGRAAVFATGLMILVMCLLYLYGKLTKQSSRYQTITGKGFRPRALRLGRLRYLTAGILVFFFIIIIVLPVGILLWVSFMPQLTAIGFDNLKTMTLDNYTAVFNSQAFWGAIWNTLLLGAGTAILTSLITVLCAWYVVRDYKGAWILDQLCTIPLVFPSIVLGLAMLQLYLRLPFAFYGTLMSIVVAGSIRLLPYGMRYAHAGIIQIHPDLEQASAISGAKPFMTFMRVVLPLIAPALTTGGLFIFILAVGSVSLPILLMGPNSRVVAVVLYNLYDNGSLTQFAALGLVWTAIMTAFSASFYICSRRYGLSA